MKDMKLITLVFFVILSCSFASKIKVRFQFNEKDEERFRNYKTRIQEIIKEDDTEALKTFLSTYDRHIIYSRFKEFESILKGVLSERKYEIAEILIKNGFRLRSCIAAHLKMMVSRGEAVHYLISLIIETTHARICIDEITILEVYELMKEAIEYDDTVLYERFRNLLD